MKITTKYLDSDKQVDLDDYFASVRIARFMLHHKNRRQIIKSTLGLTKDDNYTVDQVISAAEDLRTSLNASVSLSMLKLKRTEKKGS